MVPLFSVILIHLIFSFCLKGYKSLIFVFGALQDDDRIFRLNTIITKIFLQLRNWVHPPSLLLDKFLEFIESSLSTKVWFTYGLLLFGLI